MLYKSLHNLQPVFLPAPVYPPIYGDETNEHVDNICAFIKPGVVALAWTDDKEDVQYAYSKECYEVLCRERDAKGRKFQILKLPIPQKPVLITEEECNGFVFEEARSISVLSMEGLRPVLKRHASVVSMVPVLEIETDDAWARDVGPTFVLDEQGKVHGISWSFNAWGGDYDGLYAHWEKDDLAAKRFNLPLKSSYPKLLITSQLPSALLNTISGRGIPLKVLFFTME